MLFGEGPQIKNIAADLNKLFRQGSLLNQSVQNVEGDSTADQGTSDLLAARDPVIQEISVGMSGEQSARYTVSGTPPLSLPNSLGKPFKAWEVDVLPKQDLHGYDAPWPAGGGKNKLPIDSVYHDDNTGDITIFNGSITGTFTFSADISGVTSSVSPNAALCKIVVDGVEKYDLPLTNLSHTYSGTITSIVVFSAYSYTRYRGTVKFQLESGSAATAWSPYSNLCPIHGTDKLNLFVEESYDPTATPKAVLTLPSTVYTATIGSSGGESRTVARVFNGTENWVKETGLIGGGFWLQLDDMPRMSDYRGAIICDKLTTYSVYSANAFTSAESGITGYPINTLYAGQNWIYAKAPNSATVDEFKAWLSQNPITVVYPLATPAEFAVPSVTIPTPRGSATAWATAEDGTVESMEVTYVGKA